MSNIEGGPSYEVTRADVESAATFLKIDPDSPPAEFKEAWATAVKLDAEVERDAGDVIEGAPRNFEEVMSEFGVDVNASVLISGDSRPDTESGPSPERDSSIEISKADVESAATFLKISPDSGPTEFIRAWSAMNSGDESSEGNPLEAAPLNFEAVMKSLGYEGDLTV